MFEATQRQNLLDLLRPPAGYRLESAVGTTYSLDFVALTTALLAFVDAEAESEDGPSSHIDSLQAITRLAGRVRVFVNRGQVLGPRKVSRVTVLYDRIVQEVALPEGCFHPKVWVAYYRSRKGPGAPDRAGVLRVICTSRNLTTSQSWEAFVACEGRVGNGKATGSFNKEVREFLTRLIAYELDGSSIVLQLREALAKTTFDFPKQLKNECGFLWQWLGDEGLQRYLPPSGRKALVVSPFVRKSFLQDILSRFDKTIIISTQRDLDAIADDLLMTRLCSGKNRVYVVSSADTDDGGTAMDLHAKVLIFEDGKNTKTLLGSANASTSAWRGRNCEAVVRFAPGVSIDHFCDRFVFGDQPAKLGGRRPLRGWIEEYRRQPLVEDEQEQADRCVQEICIAISRLGLFAKYSPEARQLTVALDEAIPGLPFAFHSWISVCVVEVTLLSKFHSEAALRPLGDLSEGQIAFDDVGFADLTEFLIVQVTHRKLGLQRRFIVKAKGDFAQWRDERDAQLLQQLLSQDSLRAFLQAILFDAAVRPASTPRPPGIPCTGSGGKAIASLLSELPIEDVIRSCTEDTSRIEEINRILRAFEKTQWIDDEFRRFWATFVAAEAQAREMTAHG